MRALALALCTAFAVAAPAQAQQAQQGQQTSGVDVAGMSVIYAAEIFQQDIITMGKPVLAGSEEDGDAPVDPAMQQALTYTPSPDVERRTRQKLYDSLAATIADPALEQQLAQSVSTDMIWRQFHGVLSRAGFSTTNLADVTAAYYIITWEVVNAPEATANAAGVKAVQADVVAAYAAEPRLAELTDAQKQEAASVMAYMATVAAASANQLRSAGNTQALAQLQAQVHKAVLSQGLDLAQLQLTAEGFAAR